MKRVLVISNNCFSKTDSNGRTLGNMFLGWDQSCLAQFYIQNCEPDFDYCQNYFRVTDAQALSAFKTGKCSGGKVEKPKENPGNSAGQGASKSKRNALTLTARNLVWQSGRWQKCGFWKWVAEFAPDIVFMQAGDCAFMYRIAVRTAKKQNAKLVIYNSEGYYFKNFDYFRSSGLAKMMYPMFFRDMKKALRKAYHASACIIYLCDSLKQAYDQEFSIPSETIYTASELTACESEKQNPVFTVSYCGNLGLDRHKGLIDIANALQKISKDIFVDVYGRASDAVKTEFAGCPGIRYHGLIPYEQVKTVMYSSDLVLHTESFDEFYREDLKFALSTKIADALSCGTCFLLYAPENLACSQYLLENHAAYVVTEKSELFGVLQQLVAEPETRKKYIPQALALAEKNHRAETNIKRFQNVLKNL